MEKQKVYYGLLRLASFSPLELSRFYNAAAKDWPIEEIDRLFGERSELEFLAENDGTSPVPAYDYLGQFPLYEDQIGRQYFDATPSTPEGAEFDTAYPDMDLFVRLPRHITAAHSGPTSAYDSALDFPRTEDVLQLAQPDRQRPLPPGPGRRGKRRKMRDGIEAVVVGTAFERRATALCSIRIEAMNNRKLLKQELEIQADTKYELVNLLLAAHADMSSSEFIEQVDTLERHYHK